MADNLTHSWSASQTGSKSYNDDQWHTSNYSFTAINNKAAEKIPPYSHIVSAIITATATKDPKAATTTGQRRMDIWLANGTNSVVNLVKKENGDLTYKGTETLTASVLSYTKSQTQNAGYIECSGATNVCVYMYFVYLLQQNFSSTARIDWVYNEPRAIVSVSKSGEGTVTGAGTYHWGNTYTITATPATGWKFVKWSDGVTDASRTFTVDSSLITAYETQKSYQAIFEKNTRKIIVRSSVGGSVSLDGSYTAYPNNPISMDLWYGSQFTLYPIAETGYSFDYWSNGYSGQNQPITLDRDIDVTANFKQAIFRVRWYNEDGSQLLETDDAVPSGDMPVYNGATPTKPPTAQYTYTHIGWNVNPTTSGTVNLTAVVNNIDYYARFASTTNEYQVTWLNYDGTVLEGAEWVPYGDQPSYDGSPPTKPNSDDGKYKYEFLGWSVKDVDDGYYDESELEPVTGHITYEAVFLPVVIKYNLTIIAEDCTVQGAVSGDYDYGTEFTIKAIPDFGYKVSSIYFFDNKDLHIYEGDELTFILSDHTLVRPETIRLPAPILINLDQQIKDIYAVPETKTIVYCVDGELPTLNLTPIKNMDTVKGWNFDVINTDIDEKYGIYSYYAVKRLFINDIRVW